MKTFTIDRCPLGTMTRLKVRVAQMFAWLVARAILAIGARVEVRGYEHVRKLQGPVIFAANHMNDIDSVLCRTSLPLISQHTPFFVVARKHTDYTWNGWKAHVYKDGFFQSLGAYPALRGTRDYAKALKLFTALGKNGCSILIFTGGQQDSATEPVKARGGTGYLAWSTGNPVIPIAVEGTFGYSAKKMFKRPRFIVQYGEPLYAEDLFAKTEGNGTTFRRASTLVVRRIENMRKKLRQELEEARVTELKPVPVTRGIE